MEKKVWEEVVKYDQKNSGKNQIGKQQDWCQGKILNQIIWLILRHESFS
jgi:hypothetical protein